MKIVITGTSGRIGSAIARWLGAAHQIVGIDQRPGRFTDVVHALDSPQRGPIERALAGAQSCIHCAALHAPQVGQFEDALFQRVNVDASLQLQREAQAAGVNRFVFTSTTALYGHANSDPQRAVWIDEGVEPQPRSIYHRSKLDAERGLISQCSTRMPLRILRMSRCFPEPLPAMLIHRLHRGVDLRDVASAHATALFDQGGPLQRWIVSAATPFVAEDAEALKFDAPAVIRRRCPELAERFARAGWSLPLSLDRVYDARRMTVDTPWRPLHGVDSVGLNDASY